MKTPSVAIAVSGLGRIRRGSETWATELAGALSESGVDVRLYGAGLVETPVRYEVLRCVSRNSPLLRWFGLQRRYLLEQWTFSRALIRRLGRSRPGLVHLTDPQVAWWTREAVRRGGPPVFYMDGLMLGPDWNWRFDHVQVVAPEYLESARRAGRDTRGWRVIPHFIRPEQFVPPADRRAARERLLPGVEAGRAVALAVGDFSPGSSKRLHFVVEEVARMPVERRPHLVLVGNATEAERVALEALGRSRLGAGFHAMVSLPRERMKEVYQAADVFVHAALREPFGIVLLEAMATRLPVIAHSFEVTRWIVGEGGRTTDLSGEGSLARVLGEMLAAPGWVAEAGARARRRVETEFSVAAVIPRMLEAYRGIVGPVGWS